MAYVNWGALDPSIKSIGDPLYLDEKLWICTPTEENTSTPFYPEDIVRLSNQTGFDHLVKRMGKFWGESRPVWVGYRNDNTVLQGVIALPCPPYYPPFTTQGVDLSDLSRQIPPNFPNNK